MPLRPSVPRPLHAQDPPASPLYSRAPGGRRRPQAQKAGGWPEVWVPEPPHGVLAAPPPRLPVARSRPSCPLQGDSSRRACGRTARQGREPSTASSEISATMVGRRTSARPRQLSMIQTSRKMPAPIKLRSVTTRRISAAACSGNTGASAAIRLYGVFAMLPPRVDTSRNMITARTGRIGSRLSR